MPVTFDLHHVAGLDLRGCHQSRDAVRRAIEELPEDYRNVLLLRDIVEFDTQETAQCLQINPGAVKTRLHRARAALKKLLEPTIRGGKP